MVEELKQAFRENISNSDIGSVTITGSGSVFCSGADLEYMKQIQSYGFEKALEDSQNLADLYYLIYTFPKPVIGLVNGPAIAGGCGLASVCDFVIADKRATFGYPEVKIGFIAAIVSIFLIRLVGERYAKELLLSGKVISTESAVGIGLINATYEESEMISQYKLLIEQLNKNSPRAMQTSKEILLSYEYGSLQKSLNVMSELNAKFRQTPDFKEGITSFLNKRNPVWVK